jgi:hypothetical protein
LITYRIKDWDKHFEKAQGRRCGSMNWVAVPNQHDGSGYRRVCSHHQAGDLFSAWILIVQVASKMPVRGLLYKGKPLTAKTGFPESIFFLAFEVLTNPEIGWIERLNGEIEPDYESAHSGIIDATDT